MNAVSKFPRTAALFKSNRNQSVRIPKNLEFPGTVKNVYVRKNGQPWCLGPFPCLECDDEAAFHAADVRVDLTCKGQLIGPYDLLIAGHARSRGLKLIAGNLRELQPVEGLRCKDWL
jgi:hypothetical protein